MEPYNIALGVILGLLIVVCVTGKRMNTGQSKDEGGAVRAAPPRAARGHLTGLASPGNVRSHLQTRRRPVRLLIRTATRQHPQRPTPSRATGHSRRPLNGPTAVPLLATRSRPASWDAHALSGPRASTDQPLPASANAKTGIGPSRPAHPPCAARITVRLVNASALPPPVLTQSAGHLLKTVAPHRCQSPKGRSVSRRRDPRRSPTDPAHYWRPRRQRFTRTSAGLAREAQGPGSIAKPVGAVTRIRVTAPTAQPDITSGNWPGGAHRVHKGVESQR